MSSAAAVLLSTSSATSIGSVARETRSTSRRAPSSRTTKASGPRPSTGLPSLSRALTKSVRSRRLGQQRRGRDRRGHAAAGPRNGDERSAARRWHEPCAVTFPDARVHGQYRPRSRRASRRFSGRKSLKTNRLAICGLDVSPAEPGEVFHKVAVYWRAQQSDLGGRNRGPGAARQAGGFSIARASPGASGECRPLGPGGGGQLHAGRRDHAAGRHRIRCDGWRAPGRGLVDGLLLGIVVGFYELIKTTWPPVTPVAWMVAAGLAGWAALGVLGGARREPRGAARDGGAARERVVCSWLVDGANSRGGSGAGHRRDGRGPG